MKDRIIRVEISKTIQEQQFEPLKVSVALEGSLGVGEDFDEEVTEARELCRKQVETELITWVG
jgi:hypothetical protein